MNSFINHEILYLTKVEGVLESIGLSKNESKVYIELLTLGKTTATEISKSTKIHRSNVYDALSKLIEKGIVAHFMENNIKMYEAADPSNLLNMLKEKQLNFEKFLPQLQLRKKLAAKESTVHIYNGITPAKNTLFDLLKYNKPIYVVGTPPNISKVAKGFLIEFHKERVKKKISIYHVYSKDAEQDFEDVGVNKMSYTYSKHLPNGMCLPMSTTICNGEVQLKFWTHGSSVIVIKSPEVAGVYKTYFDHFWNLGEWVDQKMLTTLKLQDFTPVNRTAFVTSYLLYDQIKNIGDKKEKEFYKILNLEPVEQDMQNYLKIRPDASKNVYDRYNCIKKAAIEINPDLLLICAAGISPLGYSLQGKMKNIIETDVKDIVLYVKEILKNKINMHEMNILDKNHIAKIKKQIENNKPEKITIVVEGLTPYLTDEEEAIMHENLKEFSSIGKTSIIIHYYVSKKIIANEKSADASSSLFKDLGGLHKTKAETVKEVVDYLKKEYSKVELLTKDENNPHKIFLCEV